VIVVMRADYPSTGVSWVGMRGRQLGPP
jgi:hypothetical protein